MATMKDVARVAGVSISTVSRVINTPELVKEETRLKIENIMKDLDFLPNLTAKALVQNNTRGVFLYIPEYLMISDPFVMHLVAGVSEALSEAGYMFQIRRNLNFLQRCDGVIMMGIGPDEEYPILENIRVPFVLMGQSEILPVDKVDIDNYEGAYKMTEYILSKGYKKIGFLHIIDEKRYANDRFEGYKQALKDYGIPLDERIIRWAHNSEAEGYHNVSDIFANEQPTAIFCSSDLLAIGAFRYVREKGLRVPEDVAIGGFDGLIYDMVPEKPLTTIRQPVFEAGKLLSQLLLRRLEHPNKEQKNIILSPTLIIRNSI